MFMLIVSSPRSTDIKAVNCFDEYPYVMRSLHFDSSNNNVKLTFYGSGETLRGSVEAQATQIQIKVAQAVKNKLSKTTMARHISRINR